MTSGTSNISWTSSFHVDRMSLHCNHADLKPNKKIHVFVSTMQSATCMHRTALLVCHFIGNLSTLSDIELNRGEYNCCWIVPYSLPLSPFPQVIMSQIAANPLSDHEWQRSACAQTGHCATFTFPRLWKSIWMLSNWTLARDNATIHTDG